MKKFKVKKNNNPKNMNKKIKILLHGYILIRCLIYPGYATVIFF